MKEIKNEAEKFLDKLRIRYLKENKELPIGSFRSIKEIENFCTKHNISLYAKGNKLILDKVRL